MMAQWGEIRWTIGHLCNLYHLSEVVSLRFCAFAVLAQVEVLLPVDNIKPTELNVSRVYAALPEQKQKAKAKAKAPIKGILQIAPNTLPTALLRCFFFF